MSLLLDTNICSAHLKRPATLGHRLDQYSGHLAISTISVAELYAWVFTSSQPEKRSTILEDFLAEFTILTFDKECAARFGQLRIHLRNRGITVPTMDLLIAATALTHDCTLVTHNTADFSNIPDLRLADWLQP